MLTIESILDTRALDNQVEMTYLKISIGTIAMHGSQSKKRRVGSGQPLIAILVLKLQMVTRVPCGL